jgi:hypothetical protein
MMENPFVINPPLAEYPKRPPDGISREQRVMVAEKVFLWLPEGFLDVINL